MEDIKKDIQEETLEAVSGGRAAWWNKENDDDNLDLGGCLHRNLNPTEEGKAAIF